MPDQLLNEQARPRVVLNLTTASLRERVREIEHWPGTVTTAKPDQVNWNEWDVLITDEPVATLDQDGILGREVPDSVPVFLVFRNSSSHWLVDCGYIAKSTKGYPSVDRLMLRRFVGAHISQPGELDGDVATLIPTSLLPALQGRDLVTDDGTWGLKAGSSSASPMKVSPFLRGPNKVNLAGTYERIPGITNWFMPEDVDPLPWIELAFRKWAVELPEHFPSAPAWQHQPPWQTADEAEFEERIANANEKFERARAQRDAEVAAASAKLKAARSTIDEGVRRLLTADGDQLAAAVSQALEHLGFDVTDMDAVYDEGARHEDLQVRDGQSEWIAITEVTGSRRGVPQQKWMRLQTHLTSYLRGTDASKQAVPWLIVNQQRESAPDTRSGLWSEDYRQGVAEAQGLAIESPALFVLVERVTAGEVDPSYVRAALRSSAGVFTVADARRLSPSQ